MTNRLPLAVFGALLPIATAAGQVLLPPVGTLAVPRAGIPFRAPYAALVAGDVDRDGHLDALLVDGYGPVHVFRGSGAGGFTALPSFASQLQSSNPEALPRLLDLDADGDLDFLLGGFEVGVGEGVEVFLGDGAGHFASHGLILGIRDGFSVADFDGDLLPDVVAETSGGLLAIVRNRGGGQFGTPRSQGYPAPYAAAPALITWCLAGRFDADTQPDLVVGRLLLAGTASLTVLGGPAARFARSVAFSGTAVVPVQVAEFDGDGRLDVLYQAVAGQPGALLQRDGGTIKQRPTVANAAPLMAVRAADVDADGNTDIVAVSSTAVLVHLGDGSGAFPTTVSHPVPWPPTPELPSGTVEQIEVGDFDEDGKADVLVAGVAASGLTGFLQLLPNARSTPPGVHPYGTGTPTCAGRITMWGSPRPAVGTADFHLRCANAPPHSAGITLLGPQVPFGVPVAGLGVVAHVGYPAFAGTMVSSSAGVGQLAVPLPGAAQLIGWAFHLQTFWYGDASLGDTCSPGAGELASSRGVTITLQP